MFRIGKALSSVFLFTGIAFAGAGFYSDFFSKIMSNARADQMEYLGLFLTSVSLLLALAVENRKHRTEGEREMNIR